MSQAGHVGSWYPMKERSEVQRRTAGKKIVEFEMTKVEGHFPSAVLKRKMRETDGVMESDV